MDSAPHRAIPLRSVGVRATAKSSASPNPSYGTHCMQFRYIAIETVQTAFGSLASLTSITKPTNERTRNILDQPHPASVARPSGTQVKMPEPTQSPLPAAARGTKK
jgi:hypothetical protein